MTDFAAIRSAFAVARTGLQPARPRDIAHHLGLSEAALLAAHVGDGDWPDSPLHATRLAAPWPTLVHGLPALGALTVRTRNAACVHQKASHYPQVSASQDIGLATGDAIDLRLIYGAWAHGFAVHEHTVLGLQRSLQWFDATGQAIHKVFLHETSDTAAFRALAARHAHPDQTPAPLTPRAGPPHLASAPPGAAARAALRGDWAALRDTQGFRPMLQRHRLDRLTALHAAGDDYARELEPGSAHELLHRAAQDGTPLRVCTGNGGVVQIHTGPVQHVAVAGPWVNVLDGGFNLHLLETHIASAWRVRKPTADGLVSSLELFDAGGDVIAQFLGARKPGQPERATWRELLASVAGEALPCAA
ncbi:MAG: hemin-degrading factor [Proteobacteria bacterium]|nr:hemin-degrading factor [Pseudomonadota bacterium]